MITPHILRRVELFPSGAEEWECQACDRHLLILTWHPDARQIAVNPGNVVVVHNWEDKMTEKTA